MPQPLFTVATIAYNSEQTVRQTIESVLASGFTDFEYIISDDNSTDNTWEIIQEYNDRRITSWRNEKNIGEYPNRNKILSRANGRYLIFVDGDDLLYAYTLNQLSIYIKRFPEAGMIWGLNQQEFSFCVFPQLFDIMTNLKLIYLTQLPIIHIGFAEMVFKIEVLKKYGPFSEKYHIGDTYIKKRLSLSTPVLYVNMGMMFWRQSANQASQTIVKKGALSFLERTLIDLEIFNDERFPLKGKEYDLIKTNFLSSTVKLLVVNTIFKGRVRTFFSYRRQIGLRWLHFLYVLKRGSYTYTPIQNPQYILINDFHFKG